MKNIAKYLLASSIAIAICVLVIALSWNRPPAYQPFPQGSANLDFPNTAAGSQSELNITVQGANTGDPVMLSVPTSSITSDNINYWAYISAANTATVRLNNGNLLLAVNPSSGTFMVMVCKH